MKKIIITISLLFLLTGCSNTITCKTSKGTITETYKIKYDNNAITNIMTTKIYKFDTKEESNNYEGIMKHTVLSNKNENIEMSYKKKKKKYILTQNYNIEKLTDDELNQYGLSKNKDELIKYLEGNGLTCK